MLNKPKDLLLFRKFVCRMKGSKRKRVNVQISEKAKKYCALVRSTFMSQRKPEIFRWLRFCESLVTLLFSLTDYNTKIYNEVEWSNEYLGEALFYLWSYKNAHCQRM